MHVNYTRVNKSNRIPYYLQVREQIKEAIRLGTIKQGDKLPNENELADIFEVSRPTIRQAIKDLEIENLVDRKKGTGTFIKKKRLDTTLMQTFGIHDEALGKINEDFFVKILVKKIVKPSVDVATLFDLRKSEKIYYFEKLRITDTAPLSFTISFIPEKLVPGLFNHDLKNRTAPDLIETEYGIHIAKITRYLEPVCASDFARIARLLNIQANEPFFYLQSYEYGFNDKLLAYHKGFYSKERSRFTFRLER